MRKILTIIIITFSLFLGSCNFRTLFPAGQATATAEAVETEVAAVTTQAYLNPSPTSTFTPTNTSTSTPTSTFTPTPTSTPTQTLTFTPTATVEIVAAELRSVGTFPENKTQYQPNEGFNIAVVFTNTGNVDWNPGSRLILTGYSGDYVTCQTDAELGHIVKPGEIVQFSLWAFGSEHMDYQWMYFQLYSDQGIMVEGGSAAFGYQPY
ncbi:MAG: hypothetical protein JEZ06_14910 [Anaerolineaceae bacterium]|nr:hypothetical protein [Anaerolineaceae bacterium]